MIKKKTTAIAKIPTRQKKEVKVIGKLNCHIKLFKIPEKKYILAFYSINHNQIVLETVLDFTFHVSICNGIN